MLKYEGLPNKRHELGTRGTAVRDYWLDDSREKLTTDEAKAAFLLIRKGQPVPVEMAEKYPGIETVK